MALDFLMVIVTMEAGQALDMGHYDPEDEERALEDVRARCAGISHIRETVDTGVERPRRLAVSRREIVGSAVAKDGASRSIAATEGEYPSRSVVISLEI